MNSTLAFLAAFAPVFLMEWGLRSSALILFTAATLWRVKNPSIRLTVWTMVLAASLSLPLLTSALPTLPLRILRATEPSPAIASSTENREPEIGTVPVASHPDPETTNRNIAARPSNWARFAVILYVGMAGTLLGRICLGLILSRRMIGRSRTTAIEAGAAEVRETDQVASPVTVGVFHPMILMPLDWSEWGSAKLHAVIAHESSHIRRRDPALQLVSMIYRALQWFNPLSWALHRSIVRAAEEISDDDAVAATSDRVFYAETLLEFVQRETTGVYGVGVPMARHERPENRIRRILNATSVARGISPYGVAGVLALGVPLAYVAAAGRPQPATQEQPLLRFEVATIKPSNSHTSGIQIFPRARVVIGVDSLKGLIGTAFGVSYRNISGGEDWTEKETYDIEAQPSDAMQKTITDLRHTLLTIEDPRLRQMLQALLIERFQLKFHLETKSGEVSFLQRNGKPTPLQAKETPIDPDPSVDRGGARGSVGYAGGRWGIFDTTMPQLAKFAGDLVMHTDILDQTALNGRFDYRQRSPDIDPTYSGDQGPSFQNFLAEMGLKLERGKGPIETLVIDQASRPPAN